MAVTGQMRLQPLQRAAELLGIDRDGALPLGGLVAPGALHVQDLQCRGFHRRHRQQGPLVDQRLFGGGLRGKVAAAGAGERVEAAFSGAGGAATVAAGFAATGSGAGFAAGSVAGATATCVAGTASVALLLGNQPAIEATAVRLAIVTAIAATTIIGWVLRV